MRDQIPLILPLPPSQPRGTPSLADPLESEDWRGLLWLVDLPLRLRAWRRAWNTRRDRVRAQGEACARGDAKAYARTPFFSR